MKSELKKWLIAAAAMAVATLILFLAMAFSHLDEAFWVSCALLAAAIAFKVFGVVRNRSESHG